MTKDRLTQISRILIVVLVIGLSVYLYSIRTEVKRLEGYGYPGIFLLNLVSSATLILPVPGVAVTSLMGAVFNPFWVAIAAGSGAALGEISGYMAGFSGRGVAQRTPSYEKIEGWMKRYGEIIILIMAFIPNPLFDIAGMIAGALRMPLWRFLIYCWIGKVAKMMLFAYGGSTISHFLPVP